MEAEIKGYLTEFNILRGQIGDAIRGLDDQPANWCPLSGGTNSIYAMLSHLIGAQDYWIRQVVTGETVPRDREAEFRASGLLSELLPRWDKVSAETDAIIAKLSLAQLAEPRSGIQGKPVTVQWCILHQLSHYATHLGHIQLTRQLWEQTAH